MNPHPIIGIPTQTQEAVPDKLPPCWIMSRQYVRVLASAGAQGVSPKTIARLTPSNPLTRRDCRFSLDFRLRRMTTGVRNPSRADPCGYARLARS